MLQPQTLSRLSYLLKGSASNSVTRLLQNEIIESLKLSGNVLDYGGGSRSAYWPNIDCDSYFSVNIDEGIDPTWVISPGDAIPNGKLMFDNFISFNTLEHVSDPIRVLNEARRVMKSGGRIHLMTPFLFPVHAHPDDYFRPTASWYRESLVSIGFEGVEVFPLSWGPFSTGFLCSGEVGPAKKLRKKINIVLDFFYNKLVSSVRRTPSSLDTNYPMAYYVTATAK